MRLKSPLEETPAAVPAPPSEAQLASSYCPRCSERLEPRQCKLICTSCGYYMSCSDFY